MAGAAQPDKADKADKAKAEHERIVAYWTPERMKAAKPRDFEKQPDGSFRQVATPKGKPSGGSKGKPGGDGGGGGGTTTDPLVPITSGSSWTAGGQALARTGKVYFTMGGRGTCALARWPMTGTPAVPSVDRADGSTLCQRPDQGRWIGLGPELDLHP